MALVDIVMSVFNGEKFLEEQLDSIKKQTYSDWRLIVRDNGSIDRTGEILFSFLQDNPGKVELIKTDVTEQFIPLSFGHALSRSSAPYVMFADADDVWLHDKIEVTLNAMMDLNAKHGAEVPLLVHTDLVLVDGDLKIISESMWKSQALDPGRQKLNQVIMHSNACGNTFLFNATLRELALPIPSGCIMHDYWVTTIAAAFGYIATVNNGTILYRQHGKNICGGQALNFEGIVHKASEMQLIKKRLKDKYRFAQVFLERFKSRLNPSEIKMLATLSKFSEMSCIMRRVFLLKYSLFQNSLIRNVGLFIIV